MQHWTSLWCNVNRVFRHLMVLICVSFFIHISFQKDAHYLAKILVSAKWITRLSPTIPQLSRKHIFQVLRISNSETLILVDFIYSRLVRIYKHICKQRAVVLYKSCSVYSGKNTVDTNSNVYFRYAKYGILNSNICYWCPWKQNWPFEQQ